MSMTKYGSSYSNGDWKCRSCKHVFEGAEKECPKCKSNAIGPIPNVLSNPPSVSWDDKEKK